MQQGAHIGPSVVIKGQISSREPLTVSGRVEGTIEMPGHMLTIEAGAHVSADVAAAEIVIAGTVSGTLIAEERIALRAGAEVDGELQAPRLSVEDGARLNGKAIITGADREVPLARAS
jgi:cytoskeletal protein CcmA (bactofilin family)